MQNNHPNDWFTHRCLQLAADRHGPHPARLGRFNCVRCPLGTNYNYATAALLFPFSTINADGSCNNTEVTPYDADPATEPVPSANFVDTPRADGDTCFAMGLMLCLQPVRRHADHGYHLANLRHLFPHHFPDRHGGRHGTQGGPEGHHLRNRRHGELPRQPPAWSPHGSLQLLPDPLRHEQSDSQRISLGHTLSTINDSTVLNQVYSLVQQLATTYGTTRNPFRLYAIGFGPVFRGRTPRAALTTLQTMQYYAGTQSSASTACRRIRSSPGRTRRCRRT